MWDVEKCFALEMVAPPLAPCDHGRGNGPIVCRLGLGASQAHMAKGPFCLLRGEELEAHDSVRAICIVELCSKTRYVVCVVCKSTDLQVEERKQN